jgi:transcriptional regulator GlxA family with amidase domain
VDAELMVTEDRGFYCGGGVKAALDLSMYLVEKFCRHDVAMQSAKAMRLILLARGSLHLNMYFIANSVYAL